MELKNLNTKFIARKIIYFDEVNSTQKYAKSLEKVEEGTVIIANSQNNGIGTHDRKWYTGKGNNIAMTFILYPNCNIKNMLNLTKLIAVCMIQSIENLYSYKLQIKDPNDIVYNDKKIGGILTESVTEGEKITKLFIGIGLNVNQINFPGTLENIASSLKKEFNKKFEIEEIISEFFNIFEKEYLKLLI